MVTNIDVTIGICNSENMNLELYLHQGSQGYQMNSKKVLIPKW